MASRFYSRRTARSTLPADITDRIVQASRVLDTAMLSRMLGMSRSSIYQLRSNATFTVDLTPIPLDDADVPMFTQSMEELALDVHRARSVGTIQGQADWILDLIQKTDEIRAEAGAARTAEPWRPTTGRRGIGNGNGNDHN